MIRARSLAIQESIAFTAQECEAEVETAILMMADWMRDKKIVRVVGAGRALLSAAIPANRLAHGGAHVCIMDNVNPLPSTSRGGAILAASASGKTVAVLDILRRAHEKNPSIQIVGFASRDASDFAKLCDVFVGITVVEPELVNPLSALADTAEYVISELLDAMVVAAGKKIGMKDEDWRIGHEDLGPTGPYGVR